MAAVISSGCLPIISKADEATTDTGNALIKFCNQQNYAAENIGWAYCTGFVKGIDYGFISGVKTTVADMDEGLFHRKDKTKETNLSKAIIDYCIPSSVTIEQSALVVSKYLQEHPEKLNLDASQLVLNSFRTAWPCAKASK